MDWSVRDSLWSLLTSSLCLSLVTSTSALVVLLSFYLVIRARATKVRTESLKDPIKGVLIRNRFRMSKFVSCASGKTYFLFKTPIFFRISG